MVNISQIKNELSNWNITLSSDGTLISYKIDIGAQCSVILVKNLENISPKSELQPVNVKLSAYTDINNPFKVSFIVVDSDSVPILGLKSSEHLQLIKRICRMRNVCEHFSSKCHDCFGEIRTLNTSHHIEIKDSVKPVVTPVCKVPHALNLKLEKELKRMVDIDIIEPIK